MFKFDVDDTLPKKNPTNSVGAAQDGGDLMDLLSGPLQSQ